MSVYRELFVEVKADPQSSFASRIAAQIDALDRMFRLHYSDTSRRGRPR